MNKYIYIYVIRYTSNVDLTISFPTCIYRKTTALTLAQTSRFSVPALGFQSSARRHSSGISLSPGPKCLKHILKASKALNLKES